MSLEWSKSPARNEAVDIQKQAKKTREEIYYDNEQVRSESFIENHDDSDNFEWQKDGDISRDQTERFVTNAENITEKSIIEKALQALIKQKEERQRIIEKYPEAYKEFPHYHTISSEISRLSNAINALQRERSEVTAIEKVLNGKESWWVDDSTEKYVKEKFHENELWQVALKKARSRDEWIERISSGRISGVFEKILMKVVAKQILKPRYDELVEKMEDYNEKIITLEEEKKKYLVRMKALEDFLYSSEWGEFSKLEDLEKEINKNIRIVKTISQRHTFN